MIYDVDMATLGEAFIAVHADTSPFGPELRRGIQREADNIEAELGAAVEKGIKEGADRGGREGGKKAGQGLRDGIDDSLGDSGKPPWVSITGAFANALDDGLSGLPTELKAAIILGILAVSPLIAGGIAGAIGAGVAGGLVVFGVALATQFERVQKRWASFSSGIRNTLVDAAGAFEVPLLLALDQVQERIADWAPMFERIFGRVAKSLDPIVAALLDSVEYILDVFDANLDNIDIFADALTEAIYMLGEGLADILTIILELGDDGAQAFTDLVYIIVEMTVVAVEFVGVLTKAYNLVRDAVQVIPDWLLAVQPALLLFKGVANEIDNAERATTTYVQTNLHYVQGVGQVITTTKDEEKALKDLKKSIEDASEAAWAAVDGQIAFEQSLDNVTESIKENGRTLAFETQEGRNNLNTLGDALKGAQQRAKERAEEGKLQQPELIALYNKEIEAIYRAAEAQGISRARIREVYGALIDMLTLPPPNTQWASDLAMAARAAADALERANRAAWNLGNRQGGPQPFADGGIVRAPTQALIGEAGTEVVIPMTRPARAAELMRQSGLDRMFGGSGNVDVSVYLGNEAFDQHIQKVVVQDNRANARQLTYGAR